MVSWHTYNTQLPVERRQNEGKREHSWRLAAACSDEAVRLWRWGGPRDVHLVFLVNLLAVV